MALSMFTDAFVVVAVVLLWLKTFFNDRSNSTHVAQFESYKVPLMSDIVHDGGIGPQCSTIGQCIKSTAFQLLVTSFAFYVLLSQVRYR